MANANEKLKSNLNQQSGPTPYEIFEANMRTWWAKGGRKIESLCGSQEKARKMFVTAMAVVQKVPKLMECDFNTFIHALLSSAELDLYPGAKQECAYVPKEIKGKWEVQFWPMYGGIVKHLFLSGEVANVSCNIARERDEFDFQQGSNPFVHFKQFICDKDEDRGKEIAGFCSIDLKGGGRVVEIVSLETIDKIAKSSPTFSSDWSPWKKWPLPMKRKTCLKQGAKWAPKSDLLARIIEVDNAAERPDLAKPNIVDLSHLTKQALPEPIAGFEMPKMPERETVPAQGATESETKRGAQ